MGVALPEPDEDGVAEGTVVEGAADGDAAGVVDADGDGCAAGVDGAADAEAPAEEAVPGAPVPAGALRVAAGCEELLDTVLPGDVLDEDMDLHPAATSAVTTRTAATAGLRQHQTRIVKPPSPSVN
jgi:hypothetical protein